MREVVKETGYIESYDGTKIYFESRGEGPTIVMAYGIGCLMNHWRHQAKYFSQNYRTVLFDYRGHHMSERPALLENLNVHAIAKDLKALCDHLKIEKASFWGHSFGAQVLLRTYDNNPELFENLVFINGFATNPLKGMYGLDLDPIFRNVKKGYETLPETISTLWKLSVDNPITNRLMGLAGGFNLSLTSFKDIQVYTKGVASIDFDVFTYIFESMINYNATAVLEEVKVPTLIIGGAKDSVTPLSFQREFHQKIKGSKLQIIPYGSHCSQLDMPDLVNLRIEKFLSEIAYR
ncbi:MAG: alpha/beta hydrolase [Bdellovibrionaceae bacterium]|nr:alpha/beta hydrolase [Pseudobdellovibrionaceae bacterium]|tara:strand:- start:68539 stop:69414 length:876 start_codon:yes stop_codon:yes gene_type:complete